MRKFFVCINYNGYHAKTVVEASDNVESIEQSILDKLGRNEISSKKMDLPMVNGSHMRSLEMTEHLYNMKRSLELEWQKEHLQSGKVNLKMIEINKEIQDVIRDIIAQEEAEAAQEIRISEAKAEVSIAT